MIRTILLALLISCVQAHMGISSIGIPSKSRSQVAFGDSFRYPNAGVCHGVQSVGEIYNLQAGTTYRPTMSFGAGHEGGHCAWAVSTDMKVWHKINDIVDCTLTADHNLPIPTNLPVQCETSSCILSWFWTPRQSGSCEIYQNCFDIKVSRATGGIERTNPSFTHAIGNEMTCQRVDNESKLTPIYGAFLGETGNGGGGNGGESPTLPPLQPTPRPTNFVPPTGTVRTSAPTPHNDECVSQAQLIAINAESSFWPRCDESQNIKGSASGYEFGLYCSREWATRLNDMLKDLGYCQDGKVIRNFLAQVAYETGYYSTLGQPLDNGSGIIHMIPQNWDQNAIDMDALFPNRGILADYNGRSIAEKKQFFREADYAWLSAAAWFKSTNRVIPGCGKDLFPLSLDEQTKCILGRVVSRDEALRLVSKHIPLQTSPTLPPSQPPTIPQVLPTPRPTPRPTSRPTVKPSANSSGSGTDSTGSSDSGCDNTGYPVFVKSNVYIRGDYVVYDGKVYRVKWWTQNQNPDLGGAFAFERACDIETKQICGGIPAWSNNVAYSGGALAEYKGKVYVAKWWTMTTPPPSANSWAFQNECENAVELIESSPSISTGEAAIAQASEDATFNTFMQFVVEGVAAADAEKFNAIVEDFKVVIAHQYGTFFDINAIKNVETTYSNAERALDVIVELQFKNYEEASDASAVLKQFENQIVQSFQRTALEMNVGTTSVEVRGHSGVVAMLNTDDNTEDDIQEVAGATAANAFTASIALSVSAVLVILL